MKKVFFIFVILVQIPSIVWADTCPAGYQPAEYQVLEYIESTGTQYIDTGVKFTGTTSRIDARYKLNLASVAGFYSTLSATQSNSNTRWGSLQYDKTLGKCTFTVGNVTGGSGITFLPSGSTDHAIYTTNGTSLTVEFNNATQTLSAGGSALTGQTLYLGCKNTNGTRSEYFVGNIYSYKLEIDGTLVRDFVPARRLADNVLGLWDKVNNVFYTNAGTGTFIAGPETYETIVANGGVCTVCPPNTYKDTAGDFPCTPCPSTTFSKSGSTSINDCGHVMHVDDKIYFLGPQKLTTPALHVKMPDGTIYYGSLYQQ